MSSSEYSEFIIRITKMQSKRDIQSDVVSWIIVILVSGFINVVIYIYHHLHKNRMLNLRKSMETLPKAMQRRGSNTRTQIDMSQVSTFLRTLLPIDSELSIPGFLEVRMDQDFVLTGPLGKGGNATVFLGDIVSDEMMKNARSSSCAVKLLKADDGNAEKLQAVFLQEVSLMWLFNDNPYFVKLYGFSFEPLAIVMQVYSCSLNKWIFSKDDETEWTPRVAMKLASDISLALEAMHDKDISHSDIKPDNILLEEDDSPEGIMAVVSDLGISKILSTESVKPVSTFKVVRIQGASAAYASPESFLRLRDDPMGQRPIDALAEKASDVYSLGICMFELVTRTRVWSNLRGWEQIERAVLADQRPELPVSMRDRDALPRESNILISVMEECWKGKIEERITIEKVVNWLTEELNLTVTASETESSTA
eukprot:Partr_v1_DN27069_c1_g1_i1_m29040 putative protein kinase kinase kinase